jgi:hypothetical protein
VYGSARPSYLKELDTIHNQGLRISLGAFRTSPVDSLYVEAHEPSLYHRRHKLSLQYAVKLASLPGHPAFDLVFRPSYEHLYLAKTNAIPPFGIRIQPLMSGAGISSDIIANISLFQTPPWEVSSPRIDTSLSRQKKSDTNSAVYQSLFLEIRSTYKRFAPIYTDGSKDDARVAAATVTPSSIISIRLPSFASIFTAELQAIIQALEFIITSDGTKYIIFTDSLSCLQAFENKQLDHPLVAEVFRLLLTTVQHSREVVLC